MPCPFRLKATHSSIIMQSSAEALNHLENYLRRHRRAALLFSGGLDSGLLLAAAARALGPGFCAITLVGPHIVPGELAAAWALARRLGVRHLVRSFDPLALPDFRENSRQRCYACKRAIIAQAWQVARKQGAEVLWDGTNLDDLGDFRPGLQAARELGVASPLLAAGLDKAAIRSLSRTLGLHWQKPPQSCLATRFPYGAILTRDTLGRVGQAEAWLRRPGFAHVRLRVPEADAARLELAPEEWPAFLAPKVRRPFTAHLLRLGFSRLSLDLPQ